VPPTWTTYVNVDDIDKTTALVKENGGRVFIEPMTIMDAGRMAYYGDSTGASFAAWEPNQHKGAQLVNEPVSLCWNELATRDGEAAKNFYGAVFGWQGTTADNNDMPYTQWFLPGRQTPVGGMIEMTPDHWPAAMPAHWMAYFSVHNTDATVEKAQELRGQVVVPVTVSPQGPLAILSDPQGAKFAVIQLNNAE